MKRYAKLLLTVCLLICLSMVPRSFSVEASTKAIKLKAGKTYKYDLNGDKKKEKLKIKEKRAFSGCTAQIYINDKLLLTKKFDSGYTEMGIEESECFEYTSLDIYLLDLNQKDKYREILIGQRDPDRYLEYEGGMYIYRYNGKKITKYASLKSVKGVDAELKTTQPGNGRFVLTMSYMYEMPIRYEAVYKKSGSSMKLSSSVHNLTSACKKYKFAVRKGYTLKATSSCGKGKTVFTAKAGDKITISKVSYYKNAFYIYAKNSKGKKGWARMDFMEIEQV